MNREEIDRMLGATLEDRTLSRGEKRALKAVLNEIEADGADIDFWRHRAFALASEKLTDFPSREVLEWLEDVVKLLKPAEPDAEPIVADACFSPGPACRARITHHLTCARKTVDICVFTITDDQLAQAVLDTHRRGVAVRIISDNEKTGDTGSDLVRLAGAGVDVRVDRSEHHMHHKFALFDRETLITGSYNWTVSAARHNRENIAISSNPRLVRAYTAAFEDLWGDLADLLPGGR